MRERDRDLADENLLRNGMSGSGRLRRRKGCIENIGFWGVLTILLVVSSGIERVDGLPLAQAETPLPTTSSTQLITSVASPGATLNPVSSTSTTDSTSVTSTKPTSTPGTVVTDSPLVRTTSIGSESSLHSVSSNSSIRSASGSITASSTSKTPAVLPTSTTDDDGDDDDDGPKSTDEKTYNSLVNFYFLILAGVIGFAVLGWYLWRRRRKGKTSRDQRRGLEALRRDLELGRLRRGFLGVVGRGGNNNSPTNEELPAYVSPIIVREKLTIYMCSYQSVRVPLSSLARPPGYEESTTEPRTASVLHTIEEEHSVTSRSGSPEIPLRPEIHATTTRQENDRQTRL